MICFLAWTFGAWIPARGQEVAPPEATSPAGCVVRSIELANGQDGAEIEILTESRPSSIGARLQPGEGVFLDLSGCLPDADLAAQRSAKGLVETIDSARSPEADASMTTVAVRTRRPFEYSVQSDGELLSLRLFGREAWTSSTVPAEPLEPLVRVLEPIASRPEKPLEPQEVAKPESSAGEAAPQPPIAEVLRAAVEDWRAAWASQQVEAYLDTYAATFRPAQGIDRSSWEAERRRRLTIPSFVEVSLDRIQVDDTRPDRMATRFWQSYRSDAFSDQVYKELIWIEEDGRWKIQEERVDLTAEPDFALPEPTASPARLEAGDAAPAPTRLVEQILEAARGSVREAPTYDSTYRVIAYPGGDPGRGRGSGVDLVVRAFRAAGIDLQQTIHEDILGSRDAYDIVEPDPNIDHRRIRNLVTFLRRGAQELTDAGAEWLPGDLVFWALDRHTQHVGIVSDRLAANGTPLVIHHRVDQAPREEDVLFEWPIHSHFRWRSSG